MSEKIFGRKSLSIVSLLHGPADARGQAAFAFDHAHEHGKLVDAMENPSAFNLPHYLLDPIPPSGMGGADMWSLNHQQAHDDASNWFDVKPSLTLIDTPTQQPGPFQWFLFTNQAEHVALNQAAINLGHEAS